MQDFEVSLFILQELLVYQKKLQQEYITCTKCWKTENWRCQPLMSMTQSQRYTIMTYIRIVYNITIAQINNWKQQSVLAFQSWNFDYLCCNHQIQYFNCLMSMFELRYSNKDQVQNELPLKIQIFLIVLEERDGWKYYIYI